jgi:hypothetical protein
MCTSKNILSNIGCVFFNSFQHVLPIINPLNSTFNIDHYKNALKSSSHKFVELLSISNLRDLTTTFMKILANTILSKFTLRCYTLISKFTRLGLTLIF